MTHGCLLGSACKSTHVNSYHLHLHWATHRYIRYFSNGLLYIRSCRPCNNASQILNQFLWVVPFLRQCTRSVLFLKNGESWSGSQGVQGRVMQTAGMIIDVCYGRYLCLYRFYLSKILKHSIRWWRWLVWIHHQVNVQDEDADCLLTTTTMMVMVCDGDDGDDDDNHALYCSLRMFAQSPAD